MAKFFYAMPFSNVCLRCSAVADSTANDCVISVELIAIYKSCLLVCCYQGVRAAFAEQGRVAGESDQLAYGAQRTDEVGQFSQYAHSSVLSQTVECGMRVIATFAGGMSISHWHLRQHRLSADCNEIMFHHVQ